MGIISTTYDVTTTGISGTESENIIQKLMSLQQKVRTRTSETCREEKRNLR
jgi:hypothetical protein